MGSEPRPGSRREFPDARIIVLSTYAGDEEILRRCKAGALAYLLKTVQRKARRDDPPRRGRARYIPSRSAHGCERSRFAALAREVDA